MATSIPRARHQGTARLSGASAETRVAHPFIRLRPRLYYECRIRPAMAINGRRNKPFGPGGGTRRLHQIQGSALAAEPLMGAK